MTIDGQVLGHLVRRGVVAAHHHFNGMNEEIVQRLQQDAKLYENAEPDMKMDTREFLPVLITAVAVFALLASIRYTIGNVVASLAMIESPSMTTIVESKPPAYTEGTEEKEALLDEDRDVEIMLIQNKPVTANFKTAIGHLHQTGGFFARWRGLGYAMLYHTLHGFVSNFLASLFGLGMVAHMITYIFASLALARVHMAWTHKMISAPSALSFRKRFIPRQQCKAILLPTLVYAVAQQATMFLPAIVAVTLGLPERLIAAHGAGKISEICCADILRFLAIPATALFVAVTVLLPAAVTLTRVEAALLPEDQETVVPFDRSAVLGELDMAARGSANKLFVQAWRSFDRPARLRLIKLYGKLALVQFTVFLVGAWVMGAEIGIIGGNRLTLAAKSGAAQMRLAALGVHRGLKY